ncbi:MAG TPA: hypothetical protein VKW06_12960 [Candidatus Angelobacter sp.]|nr:hypothetical protein [Candidatus Angelobacter sp.]
MIGFAIGATAGFVWGFLWAAVLRAAGIPVFGRSPEQREIRRQRYLRMGQARYMFVEGILGFGFACGLAIAVSDFIEYPSQGGIRAVCEFVFLALMLGLWHGSDGWAKLRGPVPFPPESLRGK